MSPLPPEKLRVLVIDDEPLVADSLAQILNLFGYEAASVYNPAQALDWLARNSACEFVVSDVVMDGHMSGIDLAVQLSVRYPKCKVLLMSGNNSTADLLKGAQSQGYSFDILPKPVHPTAILERLKELADDARICPES